VPGTAAPPASSVAAAGSAPTGAASTAGMPIPHLMMPRGPSRFQVRPPGQPQ
jgi:hypothetical protein